MKLQFSAHQLRLWSQMLQSIESFRIGVLPYADLVSALEGALDAGNFDNKALTERWYDLWTLLEIWNAIKGNDVSIDDVNQDLSNMELFLKSIPMED